MTPTIQANAHVTLDYTLRDDEGKLLDGSDMDGGEPISYVHGYGMLVPGLEAKLVGLAVGAVEEIVVNANDGFGERDEELVLEIDRSDFPNPDHIEPGAEFVAESEDGDEFVMRVLELRDNAVVVDANHPLAGQTLHYSVHVREVRPATDEEIDQAAEEFEAALHLHGECDHDHDDALVTLGKAAPHGRNGSGGRSLN